MPFLMDFTDPSGVTHTAAYWTIVQFNVGLSRVDSSFVYNGYINKAAWDSGLQPILGASHSYQPAGATLEGLMFGPLPPGTGTTLMSPAAVNEALVDAYALATLDVLNVATPPVNVSFFATATPTT